MTASVSRGPEVNSETEDQVNNRPDQRQAFNGKDSRQTPGVPPRYPPREAYSADEDPGVAARDAVRFALYAEELLRASNDQDLLAERAPHAQALAVLALVYEVKAMRLEAAEQRANDLVTITDAIVGVQSAIEEFGKYACGEIRGLAERTSPIAYELNKMNYRFELDRDGGAER